MYINKIDCMVTIAFTIALLIFGNLSFYNDTIWLLIIYIMSLGFVNIVKYNDNIHNTKAKKLKIIKKRHKNNADVCNQKEKQILQTDKKMSKYRKNQASYETLFYTDYDVCFEGIKLILGLIVSCILAIISSCGKNIGQEFRDFSECFFIDAFLFPSLLIVILPYFSHKRISDSLKNIFHDMSINKKGKKNVIRGIVICLFAFIYLCIAVYFTMASFISFENNIFVTIISIICAVLFLIYSINSSI